MTIKTKIKDKDNFNHFDFLLHKVLISVNIANLSNKVEIIEKYGSVTKFSNYIQ